ncbi:hypothetical protein BDQ94DRAFT_149574 [Aspergillus welwitschiae]|uniref:Uncharacterized protein n=1 Tax=Aspergillus welwitschiae TaxID=1341132 RepID=A0A3F3PT64_9EURO|nr:hypothetical protein BDQ94DRAFT_149574 [Aspergillus welwitschiae]RDH30104.1 hypothetical protein BDQ94DRAFT_149574 [Aspergillus welwitschiae]
MHSEAVCASCMLPLMSVRHMVQHTTCAVPMFCKNIRSCCWLLIDRCIDSQSNPCGKDQAQKSENRTAQKAMWAYCCLVPALAR